MWHLFSNMIVVLLGLNVGEVRVGVVSKREAEGEEETFRTCLGGGGRKAARAGSMGEM